MAAAWCGAGRAEDPAARAVAPLAPLQEGIGLTDLVLTQICSWVQTAAVSTTTTPAQQPQLFSLWLLSLLLLLLTTAAVVHQPCNCSGGEYPWSKTRSNWS